MNVRHKKILLYHLLSTKVFNSKLLIRNPKIAIKILKKKGKKHASLEIVLLLEMTIHIILNGERKQQVGSRPYPERDLWVQTPSPRN